MMEEQKTMEPEIKEQTKDGLGNIISEKRKMRRNAGWMSGRQWTKHRKAIRQVKKDLKNLLK